MDFTNISINVLLIGLAFFALFFPGIFYLSKHQRTIRKGKKVFNKIQTFENDGAIFNYLRKIDPFVFEELLLWAFKFKGFKIKRNKRYTGDGGIDGQVFKDNIHYLIQAKRYSGYINKKHLEEFSNVVKKRKADLGLFIHTGKTGKDNFKRFENIKIVSGGEIIRLIKLQA